MVALDVTRYPQQMWLMTLAWPVVALFGTVAVLWAYFTDDRLATREAMQVAEARDAPPSMTKMPHPVIVGKAAGHCGAGCTLGDIAAEWQAIAVPSLALWTGWHSLFQDKIFSIWILDFIFAFGFLTSCPINWWLIRAGIILKNSKNNQNKIIQPKTNPLEYKTLIPPERQNHSKYRPRHNSIH